jgi:S-adenosylmethionine-diacylgycerolhomoserine-N-methlytransferase
MPELVRGGDPFGIEPLTSFYGWQAGLYDWTRPLILFGRREARRRLEARPGMQVLDVGCGTGHNLAPLLRAGARVAAIDCSPAMLERARRRVDGHGMHSRVAFDSRPYGSHTDYRGEADRILFSYSLTMIPPYEKVVSGARRDLRPGGRIVVVDFLDSWLPPVRAWLSGCHVALGRRRLSALRQLFPEHRLEIRRAGLWSYFLFVGEIQ